MAKAKGVPASAKSKKAKPGRKRAAARQATRPKSKSSSKGTRRTTRKAAGTVRKAAAPVAKPGVVRLEKADADLAVRAYITSMSPWMREVARRFDLLVDQEAPNVRRHIKSGAAHYGVPGQGWFATMKGLTGHVKVTFLQGTALKPVPPRGNAKTARGIDLRQSDPFDEEQMRAWIRQAAALPGT